jgi:DNA polymerase-3 subunit gamma/tau
VQPAEVAQEAGLKNTAIPQITPVRETKIKNTPRTPQLATLLKAESRPETSNAGISNKSSVAEPFTEAQLREAWTAFAEQRKKFQAEYQMLSQPYQIRDNVILVELLSPVHETMLNNIKVELTAYLREQLKNSSLQVTGELQTGEEKKVIYTNREKFDFLAEKHPMLRELKDKLGLDTDF